MLLRPTRLVLPIALVAAALTSITGTSASAAPPEPLQSKLTRPAKSADPDRAKKAPTSVVVKFRASASASARQKALSKHGGRAASSVSARYVTVTGNGSPADLLKKLKAEPSVELASLNYIRKAFATPNDPNYSAQPYLTSVRMPEAWNVSKTSAAQTIAILDSGIDTRHPDVGGHVVSSYNAINPGSAVTDDNGHGTFVAGIAGAATNNGRGVAGAAWNARLMVVKVLDDEGSGTDADIAAGITWAASHGARVINLSLGGTDPAPIIHDAMIQATANGVLVVVAAGNDYNDVPQYPAAYPEGLAVAATDASGSLADFSSYGDWVDVAAPGWDITSTIVTNPENEDDIPYGSGGAGTSYSAPIVAGVAALMRNKFTTLTPAQIMARIKATARDAGPRGLDPYYGAGLLDAYNAMGGTWAAELPLAARGANEPNDLPAQATPLGAGTSTTGTIATEGDVDWYTVTSSAARNVVITTTPPTNDPNRPQNADPVLTVYNGNLQQLGFADDPDAENPDILPVTLPTGTSYIAVRSYNGARDGRAYSLTIVAGGAGSTGVGEQAWVTNVSPTNLSSAFALAGSPVVTFQRTLDPTTVTTSTVQLLHGKTGAVVPSTVSYNGTTKAVTIDPTSPLQDNTPYRISIGAVEDTSGNVFTGYSSSTFRTVDTIPGPITALEATGGYTTAALTWTPPSPAITDLDQYIVRANAGTTAPASPTSGISAYAGITPSATATGLANSTTYTFRAWAKDRSGKVSAASNDTRLYGTSFLNATNPAVILYGGTVNRGGKLTRVDTGGPVAGVQVSLLARAKNSSVWSEVAKPTTDSTGTFNVLLKPAVSTLYAWKYSGSADLMGTLTGNSLVDVRATITANLTKTSFPLGGFTGFYGYVRPEHSGQTVYLQRYLNGAWTNAATQKLTSTGNYSFPIKPGGRGTYTYRVLWLADADHATGVSPTKSFTVT